MKNKLEIFYDYTCPFCYKGLKEFLELLPDYENVRIDFLPCEIKPDGGFWTVPTKRASQIAYYLKDAGLNIEKYNDLVFYHHFEKKNNINDVQLLAKLASESGAEYEKAIEVLENNAYALEVEHTNKLVWQELKLPAVPAYRLGNIVQASSGGLLISRTKLIELLERANAQSD